MSLFRLAYLYREILALVFTTVASLFLFFSNDNPEVQAVQADLADFTNLIFTPRQWYQDILVVRDENLQLKQTVVQLNLLNAQLMQQRDENLKLKKMLGFKEDSPLILLPARVVNQNLMSSVNSIVIDVGSANNITENMGIMDVKGIVGKTIAVGENAAEVQLITDKNFKISVRVGPQRELGILSFDQGTLGRIDGIRKSLQLEKGAVVYTSGISDIYPADIPVARIVSTRLNDERAFQDIMVEILADIHNFDFVFVIQ